MKNRNDNTNETGTKENEMNAITNSRWSVPNHASLIHMAKGLGLHTRGRTDEELHAAINHELAMSMTPKR